jgi:hypothetical protein
MQEREGNVAYPRGFQELLASFTKQVCTWPFLLILWRSVTKNSIFVGMTLGN